MLAARVAIYRPAGPTLWRRARNDGSYLSANDPRVPVGLGDSPKITKLCAHWTSGRIEEWTDMPVGEYTTLQEGSGHKVQ